MIDDQQLVKDCLRGKTAAQQQLYDLYAGQMLGICYRYTKSLADAEDVLQDGFVKVFKYLRQYRSEGELGAWIRRIMVNTAINYLKQSSKYQYDLSFTDLTLHLVSEDDPQVYIQTKELVNLVRQLPAGYQTVFNMHAVEGYTHVEIGEILGISEGTSRSQYMRARNLLISWIEKHSVESKLG
ncbi:MAG: RNA polymerase sigma factor [Chitinophagaceae bacterium]|nr:RNA polymerase sigma factor [Chitinophagaceae bacterium]